MKRLSHYPKQAWQLFQAVRHYQDMRLRWLCRYHLYCHEGDYTLRTQLCEPTSKQAFLQTLRLCLRETHWLYGQGLYDKREHYENSLRLLAHLMVFTKHYPLLWYLCFYRSVVRSWAHR